LCRKCPVKYVIKGEIEGKATRERRDEQLLEGLKENKVPEIEKG
jgi:hypothetical protein